MQLTTKAPDGTMVFRVGRQQLWDWTDWTCEGLGHKTRTMWCAAESLQTGDYVVVECCACFGAVSMPHVCGSFRSMRIAVMVRDVYMAKEPDVYVRNGIVRGHEFEIWHIVDDCELWSDWEKRANLCRQCPCDEMPEVSEECEQAGYVRITGLGAYCAAVDAARSRKLGEYKEVFPLWFGHGIECVGTPVLDTLHGEVS